MLTCQQSYFFGAQTGFVWVRRVSKFSSEQNTHTQQNENENKNKMSFEYLFMLAAALAV